MTRNLVLFCDGTSNRFAGHQTNVLKLCNATVKDSERQLYYYLPGLGTREITGVPRLASLAVGYGLKADVAAAYIYLMNMYRPGDRVFLFGFSRGAYTVRVLASMLRLYGLPMIGNEAQVPHTIDMFWSIHRLRNRTNVNAYFQEARDYAKTLSTSPCKPHFMGVWDTVNSVGWIGKPLALPHTRNNPDITIIRHAIAIDERRAFFRVNWFEEAPGADLQQVWFPGSHGDIGGGHPEAESALSKYPLEWIAREAEAAGLLLNERNLAEILGKRGRGYVPARPEEPRSSLKGLWHLAEFVPKVRFSRSKWRQEWRMNLYRRRTMPDDACVHDVAWDIPGYADRLPADAVRLSEKKW